MANSSSKNVKIELYKWSSSEFPQEYALVYTSLDDASRISTLRLSVNTDMVLCGLADDMCKEHPRRCHVKITALRDSRGDCKFGEVVLSDNAYDIGPSYSDELTAYYYESDHFSLTPGREKLDPASYWEFCHSCDVGARRKLQYYGSIHCNKETGLSVEFKGPFIYKFVSLGCGIISFECKRSKREVLEKPPNELIANAESEFEGAQHTLLKRNPKGCTLPSGKAKKAINKDAQTVAVVNTAAQATGLINNIGGQTQGHFNGAILKNVQFFGLQ